MTTKDTFDLRIHPLVIMHIADHLTRLQQQTKNTRAFGVLMGQQQGRVVNVMEAFELIAPSDEEQKGGNKDPIDMKIFEEEYGLFKESYADYELLGWYCTGEKLEEFHTQCQNALRTINERPLLLLFNDKSDNVRELPITLYEEIVHQSGEKEFNNIAFKIESDEAERVTAVHCAKVVSQQSDSGSTVTATYTNLHKAVTSLKDRVKAITQYLRDVKAGKIEGDQRILRQIKGMCNRLPTMISSNFQSELLSEYNDALLITYLAAITKSSAIANDVVEKFNSAFGNKRG